MKLGIDISQIVYEGTGVSRFTKGLVSSIIKYDTTNQWTFFFSSFRRKLDPYVLQAIRSKGYKLEKFPIPPTVLAFLWNDLHVYSPSFLKDLDWFITSDWTEPPTSCKKATVVHDLIFKKYPETVDEKILATQTQRMKWVQKESDIIFADSNATKKDLINVLELPDEKVIVNYPGVTFVKPTEEQIKIVKKKYSLEKPFILAVGKIEPRKNLKRLIQAYNDLKPDVPLLIAGPKGWGDMQIIQNKNIRFLGHISDSDLYALYASCLFFIMPSIYEGFGYPPVEAMQLGAPTAISETSSLKEIGENASLFFDPLSVDSIKGALKTMIEDEQLRKDLQKKGFAKAEEYTWEKYYTKMMSSLQEHS